MKVYGIDVSHHQDVINWQTVAGELRRVNGQASQGFALLRVGYGNRNGRGGLQLDGQILANLNGCQRNKIPMGIYVYCYDTSPEAAQITMTQALHLIKDYQLEYPVIYDIEYGTEDGKAYNGSNYKYDLPQNRQRNTEIIKAAMQTVEAAGYYGMVYASRNFFLNYTNLPDLQQFDAWEAAYTATDTAQVKNGIWQFSSTNPLKIAGFGEKLDCDVAYKDYPAIIKAAGLNHLEPPKQELYNIAILDASKGDADHICSLCDDLKLTYKREVA